MSKNLFHFPKTKIFNIIQMRIFLKITQNCNKIKNNITNKKMITPINKIKKEIFIQKKKN